VSQAQDYKTINVDGVDRYYLDYVPQNLGENRPLILALHGNGGNGSYHKGVMRVESVADTAKFVTVFPNGIDKTWDIGGNKDLQFMQALINEMYRKYKINRNRVYITGWSMGGMFTYYAMMKAADTYAAFAPLSGYHFWGGTATSSRPVPILHIHGKDDDVVTVGNLQTELNKWINRDQCNTTKKITNSYRGATGVNLYVWDQGKDGVEVRYLEIEGMKHAIYNGSFKSIEEIWNFCKHYSLNKMYEDENYPDVSITAPTPYATFTMFTPVDKAAFPDYTIKATASDKNGIINKVDFYEDGKLLGSRTESPYEWVLTEPQAGKHTIKVVATDNDGEKGMDSIEVKFNQVKDTYRFHDDFVGGGGTNPAGWTTYDGSTLRNTYLSELTGGARVFQFTGTPRDFDWGLYFRNMNGTPQAGYAKYGAENSSGMLTLTPGQYKLIYKMCNWNRPEFNSPINIIIESRSGKNIASKQFTPTVNIGNRVSLPFSGIEEQSLTFDITESGDYVLSFYAADQVWGDGVIGELTLSVNPVYRTNEDKEICEGESYKGHTASGTYTENLKTINGCDSVVVTILKVKPLPRPAGNIAGATSVCAGVTGIVYSVPSVLYAASYAWELPDGSTVTGENSISVDFDKKLISDSLKVKGVNSCGSGGQASLVITVNPMPSAPFISLVNNELISDAPAGNQWYYNKVAVPNAVSSNYTPDLEGVYFAIVSLNGCSSVASNAINYVRTAAMYISGYKDIILYPNPTFGMVYINTRKPFSSECTITVYNNIGSIVETFKIASGKASEKVDMGNYSPGLYMISFSIDKEMVILKVVRE
jgi:poly(3-hydroxybutyrate) depolymerase